MPRPIVFFDLETTGPDIVADRAIQFAAIKLTGDLSGEGEEMNILINPGRPILPSAIEVHHITDEMVAGRPKFCELSTDLFRFIDGCDYAGYNIVQFDVPMLSEEFSRCGIEWPAAGSKFLDALHVFREKERRDLAGAMRFYLDADHIDAHDALADVKATRRVLVAQMARYADVSSVDSYGTFCTNPNALDLAGKIMLNEAGEAVYAFGKDKGKSVKRFPGFGQWMLGQSFSANTKNIVRSLIYSESKSPLF